MSKNDSEAREQTAQIIRFSDYQPKAKPPTTYPRFRKAEDERPPFPGGIDDMPV
jgi:hypothetical protein